MSPRRSGAIPGVGRRRPVWEVSRYAGDVRLERRAADEDEASWVLDWRRR